MKELRSKIEALLEPEGDYGLAGAGHTAHNSAIRQVLRLLGEPAAGDTRLNLPALQYQTRDCKLTSHDAYWCGTHGSQLGASSDGWAGCTKAMVADLRLVADAVEQAQEAANALLVPDFAAYDLAEQDFIEPGLTISAFLLRCRGEAPGEEYEA